MTKSTTLQYEKKRLVHSLWFPLFFVVVLWLVKGYEAINGLSFSHLGLYPLRVTGLVGIVTAPFIHGNWSHLLNNSTSLFLLTWALFYFYHHIAWKVFFWIWFMNGFWLWFFARPSYHIGASGLIYGFATFLFLSGLIRRNQNLLAISLLVAFLYGSMIWGIFPIKYDVSWESHLTGLLAGSVMAIYFRNYGPSPTRYFLFRLNSSFLMSEDENDDEHEYDDDEHPYWITGADDDEKL